MEARPHRMQVKFVFRYILVELHRRPELFFLLWPKPRVDRSAQTQGQFSWITTMTNQPAS